MKEAKHRFSVPVRVLCFLCRRKWNGADDALIQSFGAKRTFSLVRNWDVVTSDNLVLCDIVVTIVSVIFVKDVFWQVEPKDYRSPVCRKLHDKDLLRLCALLKDEVVTCDVPVANLLGQRTLKHHLALLVPHLQKVLLASIDLDHFLINNFDKHRAEVALLVVLATSNEFVELVERNLEHDLLQELRRRTELVLILVQTPI